MIFDRCGGLLALKGIFILSYENGHLHILSTTVQKHLEPDRVQNSDDPCGSFPTQNIL